MVFPSIVSPFQNIDGVEAEIAQSVRHLMAGLASCAAIDNDWAVRLPRLKEIPKLGFPFFLGQQNCSGHVTLLVVLLGSGIDPDDVFRSNSGVVDGQFIRQKGFLRVV